MEGVSVEEDVEVDVLVVEDVVDEVVEVDVEVVEVVVGVEAVEVDVVELVDVLVVLVLVVPAPVAPPVPVSVGSRIPARTANPLFSPTLAPTCSQAAKTRQRSNKMDFVREEWALML